MTIDRRRFLSLLALAGAVPLALPALAGCGRGVAAAGPVGALGLARSAVRRTAVRAGDLDAGARLVSAFTGDLLARLAADDGNLVCSPYSMALALAMARDGAVGVTADEMDHALGSTSAAELDAGLNAVTQTLATRVGTRRNAAGRDATVALEVACTLFGQAGITWKQPFLDELAASYGAGVQLVDYLRASEAARTTINAWVEQRTAGLIRDLVPPGGVDDATRLVLVNALHLRAPWHVAFPRELTSDRPFHLASGRSVSVPTMTNDGTYAVGRGAGWVGVRLPYTGQQLAMTLVLPDEGREKDLLGRLSGGLAPVLSSYQPEPVHLELPRFSVRWGTRSVTGPLRDMGMPTAFTDRADFSGMTADEALVISDVFHQATITVDEEGTEAAAATAVGMVASSSATAPVQATRLLLNRSFFYVIHDVASGTPLFVGRVSDPTPG